MRASCGVYARLGRYFSDADELADAAVMTRPTLSRVLKGQREFTRQEKAAITGALLVKVEKGNGKDLNKAELLTQDFDKQFKVKELNL